VTTFGLWRWIFGPQPIAVEFNPHRYRIVRDAVAGWNNPGHK